MEEQVQIYNSNIKKRGILRIYFGYAAGVGKTCAMLSDAHHAMQNGIDVVAGYIEPHQRPETAKLVEGLECLAPLEVYYKGIKLREFNLDLAIERKPKLILVDEYAHTNANISRHKKRYQDVEELLKAGIDVYTTVNVQHIESLYDLVQSITGVYVSERIPDSAFDIADQIELVDISPEDLIERLENGKVYKTDQAERALNNFFTLDKLTALREIALRKTADKIYKNAAQLENEGYKTLPTNEHVLVCLSSKTANTKVIRAAARLADAFHGSFTALYVENNQTKAESPESLNTLRENIRLAEQLGAQITTLYGDDIAGQIAEYAKLSKVTKIVIGKVNARRNLFTQNYADRLLTLAPSIDIYIIPDSYKKTKGELPKFKLSASLNLADSLKSVLILVATTLIGFLFEYFNFSVANIITIYILGVQVNAIVTTGRLYSIISSILSVLVFNYFFTEPRYSLEAYDPGYPITFLVMLIAAILTSTLTKQVKEQAFQSAQKSYRTEILLETSHKLQQASSTEGILKETALQIAKLLSRMIVIYPVTGGQLGDPILSESDAEPLDFSPYLTAEEMAVARWVSNNNKRAGATTNTLSGAKCLYLAIRSKTEVLAVIAIPMDTGSRLDTFEKNILIAILSECALALEKEAIDEAQKNISLQMQQEQLRANLLRSISHDLRTPLTSISGNAGILLNNTAALNPDKVKQLYFDIHDDAMWLINLVENLLSITRIDNGSMQLQLHPELIEEVVEEALKHINRKAVEHQITVSYSEDILMAYMDSRLIIQVIINLVDNAIKYTQVGSSIKISAKKIGSAIWLEVSDDGPGINPVEHEKLFDMFYTVDKNNHDGRRGLGLGLSLCKSIVQAHGGSIYVKNNQPKGTIIGFSLKAEEVILDEQDEYTSR